MHLLNTLGQKGLLLFYWDQSLLHYHLLEIYHLKQLHYFDERYLEIATYFPSKEYHVELVLECIVLKSIEGFRNFLRQLVTKIGHYSLFDSNSRSKFAHL